MYYVLVLFRPCIAYIDISSNIFKVFSFPVLMKNNFVLMF